MKETLNLGIQNIRNQGAHNADKKQKLMALRCDREQREMDTINTQLVLRLRENIWETQQEHIWDDETEKVKLNMMYRRQEI